MLEPASAPGTPELVKQEPVEHNTSQVSEGPSKLSPLSLDDTAAEPAEPAEPPSSEPTDPTSSSQDPSSPKFNVDTPVKTSDDTSEK